MHFTTLVSTVTALAGLAGGAPAPVAPRGYSVSADDGFPDPSPEQLAEISKQAGGTLSNAPPPKINASSVPIFQLVAFNENFEVAYFSSMIHNLTSGYYDKELEKNPKEKKVLLEILQTISAVGRPDSPFPPHNVLTANAARETSLSQRPPRAQEQQRFRPSPLYIQIPDDGSLRCYRVCFDFHLVCYGYATGRVARSGQEW